MSPVYLGVFFVCSTDPSGKERGADSMQVGSILSAFLTLGMINWDSEWAWRFPTLLQIIGTVVISAYILAGLSQLLLLGMLKSYC